MNKSEIVVSRDTVQALCDRKDNVTVHAVGRALVVIFKNQTRTEQKLNATSNNNGIGFTGFDARSGSLTAKFYMKHNRLEDWMVKKWTKPSGKDGYARIARYWRQLDTAAKEKVKVTVS